MCTKTNQSPRKEIVHALPMFEEYCMVVNHHEFFFSYYFLCSEVCLFVLLILASSLFKLWHVTIWKYLFKFWRIVFCWVNVPFLFFYKNWKSYNFKFKWNKNVTLFTHELTDQVETLTRKTFYKNEARFCYTCLSVRLSPWRTLATIALKLRI